MRIKWDDVCKVLSTAPGAWLLLSKCWCLLLWKRFNNWKDSSHVLVTWSNCPSTVLFSLRDPINYWVYLWWVRYLRCRVEWWHLGHGIQFCSWGLTAQCGEWTTNSHRLVPSQPCPATGEHGFQRRAGMHLTLLCLGSTPSQSLTERHWGGN